MEQKTKLKAVEGKQELLITRTFDLPVSLVYRAYTEPDLIEQWMDNKVLKMENHPHGGYQFETRDKAGNVLFRANGTIHSLVPDQSIIRTFEMENTGFPVQLEFLDFEPLSPDKSTLSMKIVFRSVEDRDKMLQLPFAQGINMAHSRLEKIITKIQ